MIVYSVTCKVDNSIADQWEKYFIDKHLDDVCGTGCFTGYSFRKELGNTSDKTDFTSEYYCQDQKTLDKYNAEFALEMKRDIQGKFEGKYSAERKIYQHLVTKEK